MLLRRSENSLYARHKLKAVLVDLRWEDVWMRNFRRLLSEGHLQTTTLYDTRAFIALYDRQTVLRADDELVRKRNRKERLPTANNQLAAKFLGIVAPCSPHDDSQYRRKDISQGQVEQSARHNKLS